MNWYQQLIQEFYEPLAGAPASKGITSAVVDIAKAIVPLFGCTQGRGGGRGCRRKAVEGKRYAHTLFPEPE